MAEVAFSLKHRQMKLKGKRVKKEKATLPGFLHQKYEMLPGKWPGKWPGKLPSQPGV